MGNNIGGNNRKAKIMKIDGETFKLKLPAAAADVLKDYPSGYVLLESESVKKFGIRAPQLRPEEELKPGKIYFLIEMPMFPEEKHGARTRRVRSAGHMGGAEERLDWLMLRQKSVSDLGSSSGPVRVKMRFPKAQIEKMMEESRDEEEVAGKILELCFQNSDCEMFSGISKIRN